MRFFRARIERIDSHVSLRRFCGLTSMNRQVFPWRLIYRYCLKIAVRNSGPVSVGRGRLQAKVSARAFPPALSLLSPCLWFWALHPNLRCSATAPSAFKALDLDQPDTSRSQSARGLEFQLFLTERAIASRTSLARANARFRDVGRRSRFRPWRVEAQLARPPDRSMSVTRALFKALGSTHGQHGPDDYPRLESRSRKQPSTRGPVKPEPQVRGCCAGPRSLFGRRQRCGAAESSEGRSGLSQA